MVKYLLIPATLFVFGPAAGLCCTNAVRDSSCESSVIAGGGEQTEHTDLQDPELARIQQGAQAPRIAIDLVRC
jgi:hypothetical protein